MSNSRYDAFRKGVQRLNAARLGSFGEYVFGIAAGRVNGVQLARLHREGADFVMGANRVDVKTTRRWLNGDLPRLIPYAGKRAPDVMYARVEFWREGARVSIEAKAVAFFSWDELYPLWSDWKKGRAKELAPIAAGTLAEQRAQVKKKVKGWFAARGCNAKVLVRTVSFGDDKGPDNIWPGPGEDLSVYVLYNGHISPRSIRHVMVLPAPLVAEIPRRKDIYGRQRNRDRAFDNNPVIGRVPEMFFFRDLADMKRDCFNRFRDVLPCNNEHTRVVNAPPPLPT